MSFIKSTALLIFVCLLSACVTTMEKETSKYQPEKALATHIKLGLGYISENNLDSARFHLMKAAAIAPKDAGMLNGRGLLYQLEGEPELAEKSFQMALREDKNFTAARLNYATFLYNKERYKEAYDSYERASEDLNYDRRATTLYGLGLTAMKLGRTDRGIAAFTQAVMLQSDMAPPYLELADYYLTIKDYAMSRKSLTQFERLSRPTARSLWIGIQIERVFGNQDKEASQALSLKNMYPYSKEYLEFKQVQERQ